MSWANLSSASSPVNGIMIANLRKFQNLKMFNIVLQVVMIFLFNGIDCLTYTPSSFPSQSHLVSTSENTPPPTVVTIPNTCITHIICKPCLVILQHLICQKAYWSRTTQIIRVDWCPAGLISTCICKQTQC